MAMVQQPNMELTIMAAEGLKNVGLMRTKMNPYAVAFVEPYAKHATRAVARGGKNPVWNDSLHIGVPLPLLNNPAATLTLQVFNKGPISTALVGTTQILLQDLLRNGALKGNGEGDILTIQLFRPSGRPHGVIRVFLKLSGDGLPGIPHVSDDDVDAGCYDCEPAMGIPVMTPAMGMHAAAAPIAVEHSLAKYSYPYPAPPHMQSAYPPLPMPKSKNPSKNKNFLYGLLSGAMTAVLLGVLF